MRIPDPALINALGTASAIGVEGTVATGGVLVAGGVRAEGSVAIGGVPAAGGVGEKVKCATGGEATGGVGVAASVGGAKLWRKRLAPRVIKPAVPELFVLGRARLPLVNHECPSRWCNRRRVVKALCRGAGRA